MLIERRSSDDTIPYGPTGRPQRMNAEISQEKIRPQIEQGGGAGSTQFSVRLDESSAGVQEENSFGSNFAAYTAASQQFAQSSRCFVHGTQQNDLR